jgi:ribosome maturation factor RimP
MEHKSLERLIGKHVKIVTKEPGDEQTRIVTGRVTDVDLDRGFLMVETRDGEACLSIQEIVAIKPRDAN